MDSQQRRKKINICEAVFNGVGHRGFSLLEILVAIFVATVGLVSLSAMQLSAIKGNGASDEQTKATYLAQGVLERISKGAFVAGRVWGAMEMSAADDGSIPDSGTLHGVNVHGRVGGPFTLQWQVTANTNGSEMITITVSWKSILGRTRDVRLTTLYRRGGGH